MNQTIALTVFEYKDGQLFWKQPTNPKRTPIGSVAGTVAKRGYVHVQYLRKIYKGHYLVYLMHTGKSCKLLDHINGVLTDNRIENLRPATVVQNQRNATIRKDNSSGIKNVSWHSRIKKWGVQLSIERKIKHLGYFDDLELAALVAHEARLKYHGDFANHGC